MVDLKPHFLLIGEETIAAAMLRDLAKQSDFLVEDRAFTFDVAREAVQIRRGPVVVAIDLDESPERAFRLAEELKLKSPDVHIIMTTLVGDPEILLQAMRSGAEEFFVQPLDRAEIHRSLQAMRDKIHAQMKNGSRQGVIITVFASKGGAGTTTVATNLSVALAERKDKSVCLVDLALQTGCVSSFLNLEPSCTMRDFVKNIPRIDRLFLDGSLARHASGVRVLAEPFGADNGAKLSPDDVNKILQVLASSFEVVVVDAPRDMGETSLSALDDADIVLFITEMNIPALKNTFRTLEALHKRGVDERKIKLIVNRHVKSVLRSEAVEKTLGIGVSWTVPNDYTRASDALNRGLSILESERKSDLAESYRRMAEGVMRELGYGNGAGPAKGRLQRWRSLGLPGRHQRY